MRAWTVGGALIRDDERVLLVQNQRRDGSLDWSTPGGVIDAGETMLGGLSREVTEETGLVVRGWLGPRWVVEVEAPDMEWTLLVEVHEATGYDGDVHVDDPDGIVVGAAWVDLPACTEHLAVSWRPSREPMLEWLAAPWTDVRRYRYRLDGLSRADSCVTRLA